MRRNLKEPFFVYVDSENGNGKDDFFDGYREIAESLFSSTRFYHAKRDVFPKSVKVPAGSSVLVFKDDTYYTYTVDRGNSSDPDLSQIIFQVFADTLSVIWIFKIFNYLFKDNI